MIEPHMGKPGMVSLHHATPLAARHQMDLGLWKRLKDGIQGRGDHHHVTCVTDTHDKYFLVLRHGNHVSTKLKSYLMPRPIETADQRFNFTSRCDVLSVAVNPAVMKTTASLVCRSFELHCG